MREFHYKWNSFFIYDYLLLVMRQTNNATHYLSKWLVINKLRFEWDGSKDCCVLKNGGESSDNEVGIN